MAGYYVMRNGAAHYHADTQQAAIDWATGACPRKPPRGFKWEVWSSDGERVAIIRPTAALEANHFVADMNAQLGIAG